MSRDYNRSPRQSQPRRRRPSNSGPIGAIVNVCGTILVIVLIVSTVKAIYESGRKDKIVDSSDSTVNNSTVNNASLRNVSPSQQSASSNRFFESDAVSTVPRSIGFGGTTISFEVPAGSLNETPQQVQIPNATGAVTQLDYGADDLLIAFGSTRFDGFPESTVAELMKSYSVKETLAQHLPDAASQMRVTSREETTWNGFEALQETVSAGNSVQARYFAVRTGIETATFMAFYEPKDSARVELFFDSIQLASNASSRSVATPNAAMPEPGGRTDTDRSEFGSEPVSVLPLIDLPRDAVKGEWTKNRVGLQTPSEVQGAMLRLPVEVPESYELTMTVQRLAGTESFNIGIPVGSSMALIVVDGFNSTVSGLEMVGGRLLTDRFDTLRSIVLTGKRQQLRIQVTPNSVHVDCDGREIVDWAGSPNQLMIRRQYWAYDRGRAFIGSWESSFEISDIALRKLVR